jgi:transposase-like protein
MVELDTGCCILQPVMNRAAETLLPIIHQHVEFGATVVTDEWRSYNRLSQNYLHLTVNHSLNFVDPRTGNNSYLC